MLSKLLPKRGENGFTLIELLIVVIIIGVLAAIALPIFINQQKQAVEASVKSDARNTVTNVVNWFASHQTATPADVTEYTNATNGGKVARSNANTFVGVTFTAPGDYTVCAYNTGASKSNDSDHAVVFTSSTGQFNAGDCNLATDAAGTAGGTGGSTGANKVHTLTLDSSQWNSSGADQRGTSGPAQYTFSLGSTDGGAIGDYNKLQLDGPLTSLFTVPAGGYLCKDSGTNDDPESSSHATLPVADSSVHLYDADNNEITKANSNDWTIEVDAGCANFTAAQGYQNPYIYAYAGFTMKQEFDSNFVANDATVPSRVQFDYNGQSYELTDSRDCNALTCS